MYLYVKTIYKKKTYFVFNTHYKLHRIWNTTFKTLRLVRSAKAIHHMIFLVLANFQNAKKKKKMRIKFNYEIDLRALKLERYWVGCWTCFQKTREILIWNLYKNYYELVNIEIKSQKKTHMNKVTFSNRRLKNVKAILIFSAYYFQRALLRRPVACNHWVKWFRKPCFDVFFLVLEACPDETHVCP